MTWTQEVLQADVLAPNNLNFVTIVQNGFDNSGRRGPIRWLEGNNVDRTIDILGKVAALMETWLEVLTSLMIKSDCLTCVILRITEGAIKPDTLYGIELLNEPWGIEEPVWTTCRDKFYPQGYAKIREYFQNIEPSKRPWVTIQNAFR
jgi:hypothetical protein